MRTMGQNTLPWPSQSVLCTLSDASHSRKSVNAASPLCGTPISENHSVCGTRCTSHPPESTFGSINLRSWSPRFASTSSRYIASSGTLCNQRCLYDSSLDSLVHPTLSNRAVPTLVVRFHMLVMLARSSVALWTTLVLWRVNHDYVRLCVSSSTAETSLSNGSRTKPNLTALWL